MNDWCLWSKFIYKTIFHWKSETRVGHPPQAKFGTWSYHEWYDLFWFRILTYLNNRQMQNANLSNNWFSYLSILWWMCEFLGSILNMVVNNLTYTKFVTFWYIIAKENQEEIQLTGWLDLFLNNHWVAKDAMQDDKGSTKQ